jgi:predicted transcriptional regulator
MDHQINIQKRKRADIIQDILIIAGAADDKDTIIIDTGRHRLPSIIEDDPDDSDID